MLNAVCTFIAILAGGGIYFIGMIGVRGITAEDIKRMPIGGKIHSFLSRYALIRKLLVNSCQL